jgi:hypothetical protein
MGLGMMLVGVALMVGSFFIPGLHRAEVWGIVAFGVVLFVIGAGVTMVTSLYRKTPPIRRSFARAWVVRTS